MKRDDTMYRTAYVSLLAALDIDICGELITYVTISRLNNFVDIYPNTR